MTTRRSATILGCCVLAAGFLAAAPQHDAGHIMVTPDTIRWGPGRPGLPPGAQTVVLEGDPTRPGAFTMRAKFPDGYKVPPHYHPADEHVTVLQGTLNMGLGDRFDQAATTAMPAGSFSVMKQGMRHFAWAKGETVLQVHGIGPWDITYVNPADDPRKKTSE